MLNNLEVGGIDRFILNLGWADCGLDNWFVDWGDKEGYRQLLQLRETFFIGKNVSCPGLAVGWQRALECRREKSFGYLI